MTRFLTAVNSFPFFSIRIFFFKSGSGTARFPTDRLLLSSFSEIPPPPGSEVPMLDFPHKTEELLKKPSVSDARACVTLVGMEVLQQREKYVVSRCFPGKKSHEKKSLSFRALCGSSTSTLLASTRFPPKNRLPNLFREPCKITLRTLAHFATSNPPPGISWRNS